MSHKTFLPAALLAVLPGCYDAEDIFATSPEEILETWEGALTNEAIPGAIDGYNDPRFVDPDVEMRFSALPLHGELERIPWTDTYWPKNEGGITNRWRTGEGGEYRTYAPDEVAELTPRQLADLSPAEKYDLYVGSRDWPLTVREQAANSPNEASWTGYCHGWAPASAMYEEPKPVTVPAPDGRGIPFGSSDVKALLTFFQGQVLQTTYGPESLPFGRITRGIGTRCGSMRADLPNCHDVNPGALHALMANRVGLQGESFVLEVDSGPQTWNQPVHTYDAEVLGRRAPSAGAHEDAVEEVMIHAQVQWTVEIQPAWNAQGTPPSHTGDYRYTLELDAAGEIVGGQWLIDRGGRLLTLGEAWDILLAWDGPDEGDSPDLTRDDATQILMSWIEIPDFAWVVDPSDFPPEFEQATSSYTLLGGGLTARRALYAYFAPLAELYRRSIE